MPPSVTLVDYGIGNLLSVARALEYCGGIVTMTSDPTAIGAADRVVLPGVGAFARAKDSLEARGLADAIISYARSERPLLGICLGMQLLFDESEEFGRTTGLGLVPGKVVAIPNRTPDNDVVKLPHVGWCPLVAPNGNSWTGTILDGTPDGTPFYFVHWYHALPDRADDLIGGTDYHGMTISAVVQHGAVCGTQFHPEKSGPAGLQLLTRFLEM